MAGGRFWRHRLSYLVRLLLQARIADEEVVLPTCDAEFPDLLRHPALQAVTEQDANQLKHSL